MNKNNISIEIRNTLLSVLAAVSFSLWQHSAAAGIWMGIITICISECATDLTHAITIIKQEQPTANKTQEKNSIVECHK